MDQWWGSFRLESGTTSRWTVGPLELWVSRLRREWRIGVHRHENPLVDRCEVVHGLSPDVVPDEVEVSRYAGEDLEGQVHLVPRMADRSVVVRPDVSFGLLAGGAVSVFVSTPVWIALESGATRRPVVEVPTHRPSDTWFGSNTREGELCYVSKTSARLQIENLVRLSARAITELRIENKGRDVLELARLKVPVPHLAIHADPAGLLWTQTLTVVRERDDDVATVQVGKGPSSRAGRCQMVAPARESGSPSVIVRALGRLLG